MWAGRYLGRSQDKAGFTVGVSIKKVGSYVSSCCETSEPSGCTLVSVNASVEGYFLRKKDPESVIPAKKVTHKIVSISVSSWKPTKKAKLTKTAKKDVKYSTISRSPALSVCLERHDFGSKQLVGKYSTAQR